MPAAFTCILRDDLPNKLQLSIPRLNQGLPCQQSLKSTRAARVALRAPQPYGFFPSRPCHICCCEARQVMMVESIVPPPVQLLQSLPTIPTRQHLRRRHTTHQLLSARMPGLGHARLSSRIPSRILQPGGQPTDLGSISRKQVGRSLPTCSFRQLDLIRQAAIMTKKHAVPLAPHCPRPGQKLP